MVSSRPQLRSVESFRPAIAENPKNRSGRVTPDCVLTPPCIEVDRVGARCRELFVDLMTETTHSPRGARSSLEEIVVDQVSVLVERLDSFQFVFNLRIGKVLCD